MATYNYFISYSSKDKDIADRIVAAIESAGQTCWIAPRNIPYGTPYARAIMEGIDQCDKFVVLITKNSVQSDDVLNEVDNAHSVKKTIIPVRLTDAQLSREMNYYLSRTQWLTISSANPEEIVKLLDLKIDSSKTDEIPVINSLKGHKNSKANPYIIVSIAAIAIIAGSCWFFLSKDSKGQENSSLLANEKISEDISHANADSSETDRISVLQSNAEWKNSNNIESDKSPASDAKSQTTSKDYNKLLIDANTFYNTNEYKKALTLYMQIANNFDINYADKVGFMYYYGLGTEKNPSKGIEWCKKAADNGNHDAQIRVGYMLLRSEQYKEAAKYYHEAEKYISLDSETQNDLGYLYFNGLGVAKNIQLAKKYWISSANAGVVNAQVALGNMYYTGDGVEQNYKEAYKWYSKAADKGELNSQYAMAFMLENGFGVEKNMTEALRLYKSAAEKGHQGSINKCNSLKESFGK